MRAVILRMDGGTVRHIEGPPEFAVQHTDVPTHGSISIEVEGGVWMNFMTSEWLTLTTSKEPEGR